MRVFRFSRRCNSLTHSFTPSFAPCFLWALPGPGRHIAGSGTPEPEPYPELQMQLGTPGPEHLLDRMPESDRMPCQNVCGTECRKECQNRCRKECQKEGQNKCQIECQNECLKRCQIELQKVRQIMSDRMPHRMQEGLPDRVSKSEQLSKIPRCGSLEVK